MEIGLLWFDNDPSVGIEEKIRRAAKHYREKYGQPANICYANSRVLLEQSGVKDTFKIELNDAALRVVAAGNILPHHFWVGIASGKKEYRRGGRQRGKHS